MKLVTQGLDMYNMAVNPPLNISKEMFNEQNEFIDIDEAFAPLAPQVKMVSEEFLHLFTTQK